MSQVFFHLPSGETCHVAAQEGQSLMLAAKTGNVPGVDADCGGAMVCGTCHVIVEPAWLNRLPPPCEMESLILEGTLDPHPRARLACQIRIDASLNGLEVRVPMMQR